MTFTNARKTTPLVAFIIIAIITLSLCGCSSPSPEATFKSFVDACRSGYYAAAYRMISDKTKEKHQLDLADFAHIVQNTEWGNKKCILRVTKVDEKGNNAIVYYTAIGVYENVDLTMPLIKSGNDWKLGFGEPPPQTPSPTTSAPPIPNHVIRRGEWW